MCSTNMMNLPQNPPHTKFGVDIPKWKLLIPSSALIRGISSNTTVISAPQNHNVPNFGSIFARREKLGNNSAISFAEIFGDKTRRNISASKRNYSAYRGGNITPCCRVLSPNVSAKLIAELFPSFSLRVSKTSIKTTYIECYVRVQ